MKNKEPGRKPGAANIKSGYLRNENIHYRCTEGYNKTVDALKKVFPAKTKADILHEALQLYAMKNLNEKTDMYWINRIL